MKMKHTDQDTFTISGINFAKKVQLARIAKDMRQSDVAYKATKYLQQKGLQLKVTPSDVGYLEQGWKISKWKALAILQTLDMEDEIQGTPYQ